MSDYLTNLVQRTRGETGAVRPIVQPVFAPGRADLPAIPGAAPAEPGAPARPPRARTAARPAESGPVADTSPLLPEPSAPSAALPPAPRPSSVANRVSPTPPPPTTPVPQPSPARHHPAERPSGTKLQPSVAQADSLTGPQAATSDLPVRPAQSFEVAPLPTTEAQVAMPPSDPPRPAGTRERSARHAAQDAAESAPVTATPRSATQVAAGRPAGQRPMGEQIIPVPRDPDRLESRPAAAPTPPWAAMGNQAAVPPPSPAIRVSIGRIEVRAMLPAPPPPAPVQSPAEPLLTLDAYLRERTGRRDR